MHNIWARAGSSWCGASSSCAWKCCCSLFAWHQTLQTAILCWWRNISIWFSFIFTWLFIFYGGLKRTFSVTQLVKSPLWTILKNDFEKITFDCSEKVWKGLAPIRGKFPFWSAHFPIMWCASAVLLAGHAFLRSGNTLREEIWHWFHIV